MLHIFRSEYFEKALTNDWQEKKDKKINLKDCSVVALEVAVNFMYGIQVPEEFTELCELLNLAEMFMMENLAEVVIHRLNEEITEENYLEVCKIAEMYNKENLINKCALFVINQIGEEDAKWEVLEKLNKVLVAISKNAMKAVKHNKERRGQRGRRGSKGTTPLNLTITQSKMVLKPILMIKEKCLRYDF